MKIFFIEWNCYGKEDLMDAIMAEGHELLRFPLSVSYANTYGDFIEDQETEDRLTAALRKKTPDIVFSIDYFPIISKVCQKEAIRYISWNYDCPYPLLYSPTIINPCNRVYLFDKTIYMEFYHAGIKTVKYMPLAVNTVRLDKINENGLNPLPFLYDVSFLGSFYLEKNDNIFGKIDAVLPERTRGYLKALIAVQLKIQGYSFIEELIDPILDDLYQAWPVAIEADFVEPKERFYANIIEQRITTIERMSFLEEISRKYTVDIFTHIKDFTMPNVINHGAADYYTEMPYVFKQSRINLNITLRSIKSGIPLRAFDIMGSEGFLLSNYQNDLLELFVPEEDFVYYKDKKDLLCKVDYYLAHEEERRKIAKNGHDKVAARHTYRHRVKEMFDL